MEKPILIPPFFLFEGVSLDIFQSIEALEKKIEPQDWRNNCYRVFDSTGNALSFNVILTSEKRFFSHTEIEHMQLENTISLSDKAFIDCLKASYRAYFDKSPEELNKQEIIAKLIEKCGFSI